MLQHTVLVEQDATAYAVSAALPWLRQAAPPCSGLHMLRERAIQAIVCVLVADPHGSKAFLGGARRPVQSAAAGEIVRLCK